VIPTILIKTVYEKAFISNEAKNALSLATKNVYMVPDLIDAFVDGLNNKNIVLAEYSVGYLSEAVKSAEPQFLLSNNDTVKTLLKQLVVELDGKRAKTKKGAETIFTEIKNKTSEEQLRKLL
jgi:uncharacterized membrane protein